MSSSDWAWVFRGFIYRTGISPSSAPLSYDSSHTLRLERTLLASYSCCWGDRISVKMWSTLARTAAVLARFDHPCHLSGRFCLFLKFSFLSCCSSPLINLSDSSFFFFLLANLSCTAARVCLIEEKFDHISLLPWRRKWQPTPVFLPGKSHRQRRLEGCSSWGHKELDTSEWLSTLLPKNWSI